MGRGAVAHQSAALDDELALRQLLEKETRKSHLRNQMYTPRGLAVRNILITVDVVVARFEEDVFALYEVALDFARHYQLFQAFQLQSESMKPMLTPVRCWLPRPLDFAPRLPLMLVMWQSFLRR